MSCRTLVRQALFDECTLWTCTQIGALPFWASVLQSPPDQRWRTTCLPAPLVQLLLQAHSARVQLPTVGRGKHCKDVRVALGSGPLWHDDITPQAWGKRQVAPLGHLHGKKGPCNQGRQRHGTDGYISVAWRMLLPAAAGAGLRLRNGLAMRLTSHILRDCW